MCISNVHLRQQGVYQTYSLLTIYYESICKNAIKKLLQSVLL